MVYRTSACIYFILVGLVALGITAVPGVLLGIASIVAGIALMVGR